MYGGAENKKCKGVKKSVVKKEMSFNTYKNILFNTASAFMNRTSETNDIIHKAKMTMIRAKDHRVHTVEQEKKALTAYDSKRYLLGDGIASLAYGHKSI